MTSGLGPLAAYRGVGLILATIAIHQCGTSLSFALVPLRIAIDGQPAWVAGSMSTAFSVGFVSSCLMAPKVVDRLGRRQAVICFVATNACAALILWGWSDTYAWLASRALSGVSVAGLFVVLEAGLATRAPTGRRGFVFAAYMVVNRLVFTIGQVALSWLDPTVGALFGLTALAYVVSPLPLFGTDLGEARGGAPIVARRMLDLPREAPVLVAGTMVHSMVTTAAPALMPIVALDRGYAVDGATLLLASLQAGGLIFQVFLMLVADRFDRLRLISASAGLTVVMTAPMLAVDAVGLTTALILTALWGGAPHVIYGLCAALAADRAGDARRIQWSSMLLLTWGVGAALGPLAASLAMELAGPSALFWYTLALTGALFALLLFKRRSST